MVTGFDRGDGVTRFPDHPRYLMPEDRGEGMEERAFHEAEIAVAQTGSNHVDEHLEWAGLGDVDLLYGQGAAYPTHDRGSHGGHTIPTIRHMATIDEYLETARSRLNRVAPEDLGPAIRHGALLVDIRPEPNRAEEGEMPGAIVIDRGVLEWRLAPSSDARTVQVEPGQQVILFCNDGYQSSLAAATLLDLGVDGATDLVGGYRAWQRRRSSE